MVSIVAVSDLHGHLPETPPADLLLIAGDICPCGSAALQAKWLESQFKPWLERLPVKHVVGVAGNHDRIFQTHPKLIPKNLRWHYLQDESTELLGLKIYGTPWQLPFWGAFNLSDSLLKERYELITKGVDIVISHGPPFGILDEVESYLDTPHHTGSLALRNRLLIIKPQLVVFGHIHERFGTYALENIVFANVCLVDNDNQLIQKPYKITLHPL